MGGYASQVHRYPCVCKRSRSCYKNSERHATLKFIVPVSRRQVYIPSPQLTAVTAWRRSVSVYLFLEIRGWSLLLFLCNLEWISFFPSLPDVPWYEWSPFLTIRPHLVIVHILFQSHVLVTGRSRILHSLCFWWFSFLVIHSRWFPSGLSSCSSWAARINPATTHPPQHPECFLLLLSVVILVMLGLYTPSKYQSDTRPLWHALACMCTS